MKTQIFRFLLTLCMVPFALPAQVGRFYSTEDGLSSTLINQIYQDADGYIWIATEYGLNKFDGLHFSVYMHSATDSTTIKNNYVRCLAEAEGFGLLAGCYNGLMNYNKQTDSFQEIPIFHGSDRHVPHVTYISSLLDNTILISTAGQGIFRIDSLTRTALYYEELMQYVPSAFISAVCQAPDGMIWIATEFDGIIRHDPVGKNTYTYKYPELSSNSITTVIVSENGEIFAGTKKNGLMKFDSDAGRFRCVPSPDGSPISVYTLSEINGDLLVGCNAEGIKRYNPHTASLEEYYTNNSSYDFSSGKVHTVFQDRDNNLWIGLFHKGVYISAASGNNFVYCGNRSVNNPIGKNSVISVYTDADSMIWISSDNEGVYLLDRNNNRLRHYNPGHRSHDIPSSVPCFYDDRKGNIWLGSYDRGIVVLNKKSGSTHTLSYPDIKNANSIVEDASGALYIGTFGGGLHYYNPLDRTHKVYSVSLTPNDTLKDELVNNWINTLFIDHAGMVWIGHHKGLSCFNPMTGSFLTYRNSNLLITGCITYAIIEDSNGMIWAGTTEGLIRFDRNTQQTESFTIADGLPNNAICGICEDGNSNLWISTYNGLCRFDMKARSFVNFFSRDGIQGNEFFHGAYLKGADGKMFFAGVNGITSFYPRDIHHTNVNPDVLITDFILSSGSVNKNTLSGDKPVITTSVSESEVFMLSHTDNTFTIAFSTLQYDKPEQISYNYRIKELSMNWSILPPGGNSVTYNNLPPGSYTFQVQANNFDSLSDVRTVFIFITPPWYRSTWAYCLYLLLGLFLIYGIVNYIMFRLHHKQEIMQRTHAELLNEAKLQFFINISHEIRTPMTLIINPLEKLLKKNDKENHDTYFMIYRNAQRILRLINQLMDIRKLDKGQMILTYHKTDMVAMIEDMMLTFDYISQKKNIRFSFAHDMPSLEVWVDINNFDKVLMNILSNAFKFTPDNGEVKVSLSVGCDENNVLPLRNFFEIVVSDSGIGIDESLIERIFERFYQINNNENNDNTGTGIGLHLCRSLVNLHNGIIYAENRRDASGSRFIIRIPLGSSHLRSDQIDTLTVVNNKKEIDFNNREAVDQLSDSVDQKTVKSKSNIHILIVEDQQDICDYIKSELSPDFRISACRNGKEAYEMIISRQPDLVISDVMMPEMDGFMLCRKIKQNININHIPVVLLTARIREEDKVEGMSVGADAYLVKPFSTEILKSTLHNLISNRRLLRTKFSGTQHPEDKIEKIRMKSSDEILMSKIMKVINENIDNSELNVQMLADNVGLSRVHIHRKLKELTNMPARDFIRNIRLKQAAALLTEKNLNISEVAYATGFFTLSHFSTSFKELYGMSPSDYKQVHLDTKESIGY